MLFDEGISVFEQRGDIDSDDDPVAGAEPDEGSSQLLDLGGNRRDVAAVESILQGIDSGPGLEQFGGRDGGGDLNGDLTIDTPQRRGGDNEGDEDDGGHTSGDGDRERAAPRRGRITVTPRTLAPSIARCRFCSDAGDGSDGEPTGVSAAARRSRS